MSQDEFINSGEFDELMDSLLKYFKDVNFSDNSEICLTHHLVTIGGKEAPYSKTKRITIEIEITKELRHD